MTSYEKEIRLRIGHLKHLIPVFSDTYNISRRVKQYDKSMFVVFNTKTQKYEIHSLENKGYTHCATIPYNQLDARVETILRRGDIRNRGHEIWREMEEHNERLEKQREESWCREMRALIADTRSLFAKASWEI